MSPRITKEQAAIIEKMTEDECTSKYIAEVINKSQRTVQRYIQTHISDVIGSPWKPYKRLNLEKPSIVESREKAILEIIGEDATLICNKVIEKLPDELKCGRSTLRKAYRNLEISRKRVRRRPYERNDRDTIKMRKIYSREISRIADSKLFFYDEFGINLHAGPQFGYAVKGIFPTIDQPGNRGQNLSVICMIGIDGIIHWEHRNGAFNSDSLYNFLEVALENLPRDSTVVMDNAAIHKQRDVVQLYTTHGLKYKFLPRYSPHLNPIENFFSVVKSRQMQIRPRPEERDDLINSVEDVLDGLKDFSCHGLYRRMREFVLLGLEEREFP